MRCERVAASSVTASSQPSDTIGQISRRYSVRNATSSPRVIEPWATASTPPHVTPASTSCG